MTYRESVLPGISLDILSVSREQERCLPSPDQYCHINLPKNPLVLDRIMQYLTSPSEMRGLTIIPDNRYYPLGNHPPALSGSSIPQR